MLGWLCVAPVGLFQLFLAFSMRKHDVRNLVARTALATAISLASALLASLAFMGERALVPLLAILMLGPGVPILLSLIRARMLPLGIALFVLPPLPFIYWFVEKVW